MTELEKRHEELERRLAESNEPPCLLHPNLAEVFRQKIAALHKRRQLKETRAEAAAIMRRLVDRITLVPEGGVLPIVPRATWRRCWRLRRTAKARPC